MTEVTDKNKKFYDLYVAKLIESDFSEFTDRIAVGIAGEGSDCFGYDDIISKDHDFGTGVCLWITDEDMELFGQSLSKAYNDLVDSCERSYYTDRLRERRGVMTIHDFYSNILQIDCDIKHCTISEDDWYKLDHSCLKTATNGKIFRDDLGVFTAFRNYLMGYYPDRVWKRRIAEQMHEYSASLQVNYARCMTRNDLVAAELCRAKGLSSAMELYFLIKREYPPYYKWTFRALEDIDGNGDFTTKIKMLASEKIDAEAWEGTRYRPNRLNYKDRIVSISEEIASEIEQMMLSSGIIKERGRYLEVHVNEILRSFN